MIYFGRGSKQIAKELTFEKCSSCDMRNTIEVCVLQVYGHIYWLPFVPFKKVAVSRCSDCGQMLNFDQMSPGLKTAALDFMPKVRTPLWTFSVAAAIVLIIAGLIVNAQFRAGENEKNILAPKTGDIYEMTIKGGGYTLCTVDSVKGNFVFLRLSSYSTNIESGLSAIKDRGDAAYLGQVFRSTKAGIKKMFDTGEITGIDR